MKPCLASAAIAALLSFHAPIHAQVTALFPTPDATTLGRALPSKDAAVLPKLDDTLRFLYDSQRTNPALARGTAGMRFANGQSYGEVFQEQAGWPIVDITHRGDLAATRTALAGMGGVEVLAAVSAPSYDVISCRVSPDALLEVAGIAGVRGMRAAGSMTSAEPGPGPKGQGSVANQAEDELKVTDMRFMTFGLVQGTGIKIGTLSDSVDQVGGGISDSQSSGDLPPNSRLQILSDNSNQTDEGRAMMELIYDIAPQASTYGYATAQGGKATFAANIGALADAGMDIICDDILYFDEAIYQDDVIAQAVNSFVDSGGIYFSVAGNRGLLSREFTWKDDNNDGIAEFSGTDQLLEATIAFAGISRKISVIWAEPYGNATNDLSVAAYASGSLLTTSGEANVGADPYDDIILTGTGAISLEVASTTKPPNGLTYKIIIFSSGSSNSFDEYPENFQGIIVPHAGTPKSIAIGAAPFFEPNVAEDFSSRGPFKQFFTSAGIPFFGGPRVYDKPDFLSIDGCNTTFFGSDDPNDTDAFPNFFGTSAATPNAAAVGVLVLQAAGGPGSLTRDEMYDILKYTAEDLSTPGFDTTYGHGRINAVGAVAAALGPEPSPKALYPGHNGVVSLTGEELNSVIDKDSFEIAFDVAGDASFFLTRNGGDADPMFLLFDNQERVRASAYDNSPGNTNPSFSAPLTTGVYTLQVQPEGDFATDTPYTLTILGPAAGSVAPITLDATGDALINGFSVSPTGDLDYRRITVPEDITGALEVSVSASNFTPMLRLIGTNGLPLEGVLYTEEAGSPNIMRARLASPLPGEEVVTMVTAMDYVGTGSYVLAVENETAGTPEFLDPIPSQVAWVVRPNPVTGEYQTLNPAMGAGDSNHTLWVPQSDKFDVVTQSADTDSVLAGLYGLDGVLLDSDGPDSQTAVDAIPSPGDQYIYRVHAYEQGTANPFFSSNTFTDDFKTNEIARRMVFSGNTSVVTSQVVDNLGVQGENDYFRFVVPDNTNGTGSVEVAATGGLEMAMEVFNSKGDSLGTPSSAPVNLTGLVSGEVYYIMVRGAKNAQTLGDTTQVGEYKLGVSVNLIPPATPTPTPKPTATPLPTETPAPTATPTPAAKRQIWIFQ